NPPSRFLNDVPAEVTRPWGASTRRGYAEAAAQAPPREEFRPVEAEFAPGARVSHAKFGTGTVVAVQKNGGDVEYHVAFDTVGLKRLLQTFARLVPAGD